jgi:hypothetical protein
MISPAQTAIHGEAILAEAHVISAPTVTRGSSTHKIQKFSLKGDCYCAIRRELMGLHVAEVSPPTEKQQTE